MSRVFFRKLDNGAALFVRVTPGAAREGLAGLWTGPDGEQRVIVKVSAPPEGGRGNKAACALVAKALGLPKSAVSVTAGAKDRLKTIALEGDAGKIEARLIELIGPDRTA